MRYAEMKDSGISWFGDIPKHWKMSFVRHHYSIVLGKMLCSEPTSEEDCFAPYLCAANVHFDGISFDNIKQMWFSSTEKKRYLVSLGDLLVVEGGAGAGGCAIVKELPSDLYIQNSILRVRTRKSSSSTYLRYVIETLVKNGYIDLVCNKATIPHFTKEKLSETPFPVPPLAEQEAIAAYLDEKCGAIDKIIEEAKATIEEYKAWKASVIFEAVTKGLDPNAEMKDSGIPWIGKIPKNWNVIQLKRLCEKITDGSHFSPDTTDDGLPYVTAADVDGKGLDYQRAHKIRKEDFEKLELAGCRPFAGDVLLVKDGATTGRVGLMTDNEPCVILSSVAILRPSDMVSSLYLMYLLKSEVLQFQIRRSMAGSAMPRATLSKLNKYITVACPPEEQDAIVTYLDKQCAVIDGIIAEKQALIDDLETYKKSLIFETVTGKRRVC